MTKSAMTTWLGIPLVPSGTPNGLKTVQQSNVQIRELCQCCVAFNPSGLTKWFYLPIQHYLSVLSALCIICNIWRRFGLMAVIRLAGYIITVPFFLTVTVTDVVIVIIGFRVAVAVVTSYIHWICKMWRSIQQPVQTVVCVYESTWKIFHVAWLCPLDDILPPLHSITPVSNLTQQGPTAASMLCCCCCWVDPTPNFVA